MTDTITTLYADACAFTERLEQLLPGDQFDRASWQAMSGEPLDEARLWQRPVFDANFRGGQGDRICDGNEIWPSEWYAGVQGGPYGLANVGETVRPDVYVKTSRGLEIRAHRTPGTQPNEKGGWYSGHLQTVNRAGVGFAKRTGYFEARMQLPASVMAWPAFWLKPRSKWTNANAENLEIDVVEWYGQTRAAQLWSVCHVGDGPTRRYHEHTAVASVDLTAAVHSYGVLLDERWVTVYFDRAAICRHPLIDLYRTEWYPQLTLSVKGDELAVAVQAQDPMVLLVESVTVWGLA